MSIKDHFVIIIDRLEYYLTKEIESNIGGTGDTCYVVLYDRLEKCIKARKEINYAPYKNIEALLDQSGYDEHFINKFITNAHHCKIDELKDDEPVSEREQMMDLIDILENYLTRKIERSLYCSPEKYSLAYYNQLTECINARKEINYVPYQSVELLLKDHGYNEEFINKFLAMVHEEENDQQKDEY